MRFSKWIEAAALYCFAAAGLEVYSVVRFVRVAPGYPRLAMVLALYLLVVVWGVATGIGLLRHRNWARISIEIVAALAICQAALVLIQFLRGNPPPVPVLTWQAVSLTLGILWLVLFNLPPIERQFHPPHATTSA